MYLSSVQITASHYTIVFTQRLQLKLFRSQNNSTLRMVFANAVKNDRYHTVTKAKVTRIIVVCLILYRGFVNEAPNINTK